MGILDFIGTARFLSGLAIGVIILGTLWLIGRRASSVSLTTVTLSLPFGLGSVTYAVSDQERMAAWRLYVQLKTRKAALPFDPQYDLVLEILDSLYDLVGLTRDILSDLPIRRLELAGVSDLMLRVLNDGLRPFLTRWHAEFRRWWEIAEQEPNARDENPQTIQRRFPEFDELTRELIDMNSQLEEYAQDLLALVHTRRRLFPRVRRPIPTPPSGDDGVGP